MNEALEYDRVKSEIIIQAGEVFRKYGLLKVSMQDISKATGKGRSTLYYYFKNKHEVFEAFAIMVFNDLFNKAKAGLNPANTFNENLRSYYRGKLGMLKSLLQQYQLVADDLKHDSTFIVQRMRGFQEIETAIIQQILGWAISKKEIKPLTDGDAAFLAEIVATAFKSFEQEMLLFGRLPDFESKLDWLGQILFKGLQ